jgi:hypothetical protein
LQNGKGVQEIFQPPQATDILRSKDGKLVVIHDETTEQVGDRNLVVADSTYEQLLTVDVATQFRKIQGKSIQTVPKHTIPLLKDVAASDDTVQDQSIHRPSITLRADRGFEQAVESIATLIPFRFRYFKVE